MKAEIKLEVSNDLRLHLTTSRLSRTPNRSTTPTTPIRVMPQSEQHIHRHKLGEVFANRSFDTVRARVPSSEPSSRRLIERITELDRLRKLDLCRIAELEDKVKSLELELERVKTMSRQVLEEQEGADVQTLYRELFLTDLRKQVDTSNKEASLYRTHFEENRKEVSALRRECFQQRALLKRYREYVGETFSKQAPRAPITDNASILSGVSNDPSEEARKRVSSMEKGQFLSPPKTLTSLTVKFSRLQNLVEVLQRIAQPKDLHGLCTEVCEAAKKLAQCQVASVYIVDQRCIAIYSRGRSPHQLFRFILDKATVTYHLQDGGEPQAPLFRSLGEVSHGIRNHDLLVLPVMLGGRMLLALQCSEKQEAKQRRGFVHTDEVLLGVLCSFAALHVQVAEARDRELVHQQHVLRITDLCTKLLAARTHRNFANCLRDELPAFMEFEYAGVVFFDSRECEFFTLAPEAGRGSSFTAEVIRFPVNIGLTGEVYNTRSSLVMDSAAKSHKYNPEIDNAAAAPDTRNLMLGCLTTVSGNFVGVLQVVNKANKGKILEEDRTKMESLLTLLAGIIENCNEVLMCLEVTTVVRKCILKVNSTVIEAEEVRTDFDSSLLLNQIAGIRSMVSDWSRKHG